MFGFAHSRTAGYRYWPLVQCSSRHPAGSIEDDETTPTTCGHATELEGDPVALLPQGSTASLAPASGFSSQKVHPRSAAHRRLRLAAGVTAWVLHRLASDKPRAFDATISELQRDLTAIRS